jgi:hypothetical protein
MPKAKLRIPRFSGALENGRRREQIEIGGGFFN